ncbi:hypothetical protein GCM10010123_19670 [Pilimelia anulata]|uniref:Uncharacterized protein n=1 Tax=Pilimelia anulata TaxID=53371 RepID=A0A8J3F8V3_9ACTN|nr:hypothetical protein [Pilimelia anulata]GGJ89915.1 hypothetical protein GCM10010123_19670 [Pilimelia anulata]
MATPLRHTYTDPELTALADTVDAASDPIALMAAAITAVYTPLVAAVGGTFALADYSRGLIRPADYSIPTVQWEAICAAVALRAEQWGTQVMFALELVAHMPAQHQDPTVPAPKLEIPDRRPLIHQLDVDRDAVDVIAACSRHVQNLADYFGAGSPAHTDALQSWERQLSRLFLMGLGAHSKVRRDGPLSLIVATAAGVTFGLIFHSLRRRCTVSGCAAWIADDGKVSGTRGGPPGHAHVPNYPLGAPQPGTWRFHS